MLPLPAPAIVAAGGEAPTLNRPRGGQHDFTNHLSHRQVVRLMTTRTTTTARPPSQTGCGPASTVHDEPSSDSDSAKKMMSCAGRHPPTSGRAAPARCQRRQSLDHAPTPKHTGRCARPRTSKRSCPSHSRRPCAEHVPIARRKWKPLPPCPHHHPSPHNARPHASSGGAGGGSPGTSRVAPSRTFCYALFPHGR